MDNSDVEWRAIPGFDLYEASSVGGIRRKDNKRVISQFVEEHGYMTANLWKDGKRKLRKLHPLVAAAFHGPKPAGMECCHYNDVKSDNRASNLRWDTRKGNILDAIRNGTLYRFKSGEASPIAKHSDECVRRIREARLFGASRNDLAYIHNTNDSYIYKVCIREIRKDI
jgi:hypothetical protein